MWPWLMQTDGRGGFEGRKKHKICAVYKMCYWRRGVRVSRTLTVHCPKMYLRVDTNAESELLGCRYEVISLRSGGDTPNKPRDKNGLFFGLGAERGGGHK